MKYHTLFVIFEKAAKFFIVGCCKVQVALYGLIQHCNTSIILAKCISSRGTVHTGKCIGRFVGFLWYCRYFIDRKW